MAGIEKLPKQVNARVRPILSTLYLILGAFVLSGCEEAALLALSSPAIVVAPVGGAAIRLAEGPEIRQPVLVQTTSGESLTPPFQGNASAKFTADASTIVCTGRHKLNQPTVIFDPDADGGYRTHSKITLTCNKGLKGQAFFFPVTAGDPILRAVVDVGPANVPLRRSGGAGNYVLGKLTYRCENDYRTNAIPVPPFRIKCGEVERAGIKGAIGAIAQNASGQGTEYFTVWIFPIT